MGLPSGNRWAISNLDATGPYFFQETPFQYACSFFSWGNVTPHNPISDTRFDYNFGGVNSTEPYYEGRPYGETPGSLLTGDIPLTMDAARRILGKPWHMPTTPDFVELIQNCIYIDANGVEIPTTTADKRVTVNGILGIYLQSKFNGVRVFFACSGGGNGISWLNRGSNGFYWTNRWLSERSAWLLYFNNNGIQTAYPNYRFNGFAIRPIWNPRDLRG